MKNTTKGAVKYAKLMMDDHINEEPVERTFDHFITVAEGKRIARDNNLIYVNKTDHFATIRILNHYLFEYGKQL